MTAMRNAGFAKKISSLNLSKSIVKKKIMSAPHTQKRILPAHIECVVGSRESVRRNIRPGAACRLTCPQAQAARTLLAVVIKQIYVLHKLYTHLMLQQVHTSQPYYTEGESYKVPSRDNGHWQCWTPVPQVSFWRSARELPCLPKSTYGEVSQQQKSKQTPTSAVV